ncbi:MAG: MAPEG family protein [Cyanobacteria bacterium P01_G01_bin.54]
MLTITPLYAGILGLLFFGLSAMVVRQRSLDQVNLGTGGKVTLERRVRGHGNFAEYVPLILVLMAITELSQTAAWQLHLIGALLLVGRLAHAYCFLFTRSSVVTRVGGMILTFAALIMGSLSCLAIAFGTV